MVIFPLAADQTIAQMWSNGVQGLFISTCWHRVNQLLYDVKNQQ